MPTISRKEEMIRIEELVKIQGWAKIEGEMETAETSLI